MQVTWKVKAGCMLDLANQSKPNHVESSGSGHYSAGMKPSSQQNQHNPTPLSVQSLFFTSISQRDEPRKCSRIPVHHPI